MKKKDVITWRQGFVNAKEIERTLVQREDIDSNRSIRLALALIDTYRKQGAWKKAEKDIIWDEEVNEVRKRWLKLRKVIVDVRRKS